MSKKRIGEEYLSTGEFAKIVGMTSATLRAYDAEGIFRPSKSCAKRVHKYRYYAPSQITTVKMCRLLAECGFPLEAIRELEQSRSPEQMIRLFRKHREIVAARMRRLREVLSILDTYMRLMRAGVGATESELSVCEMAERRIVLGEENACADTVGFHEDYVRFISEPHEGELNRSYPVGGYFESVERFMANASRPSRFFAVNPQGADRKAAGMYLVGYTRGYYGNTHDLPERMAEYADQNGLVFAGPVYNLYLLDEICIADPDRYLLQVSVPVKETRCSPSRRSVLLPIVGAQYGGFGS